MSDVLNGRANLPLLHLPPAPSPTAPTLPLQSKSERTRVLPVCSEFMVASGSVGELVRRASLLALYLFGITFCVPLSLLVWFVRRELCTERGVAGDSMQVVIIHPEQWNGGSDRCTVGLIRHFAAQGHRVVWLTTMIDDYWKDNKFEGVELRVVPLNLHPGDWFSQNAALGWYLVFSDLRPDLVVVDHSASCVPLIKWRWPQTRILFYCHYPQQLVTPSRFFLYRWYANLIGIVEEEMFQSCDVILVNSEFTASQFHRVMPRVPTAKVRVAYPPCDVDSLTIGVARPLSRKARAPNARYTFLSMNRFWPEKRLDIIVEAAASLRRRGYAPSRYHVKLAGSVMPHIPESRIYYQLLVDMVQERGLQDCVTFVASPSEDAKFALYRECDTALYTPANEHFGIVPIEALDQRRPVIVIDSGGPAETVIEGVTGTKIATTDGELLADAMETHMRRADWPELDDDRHYVRQRARFDANYSLKGFGARIDEALAELFPEEQQKQCYQTTLPSENGASTGGAQLDFQTARLRTHA